jgi:protein-tyrosine phosphatase
MAEVLLRDELDRAGISGRVEVDSAGTGDWHVGSPMDPRARAELSKHGYDGAAHRARQFQPSWFLRYDLIIAMDRSNLALLRKAAPDRETAQRTALLLSFGPAGNGGTAGNGGPAGNREPGGQDLEVPDPYNGGPEDYALVFDLVQPAARGLAGQLATLLAGLSST